MHQGVQRPEKSRKILRILDGMPAFEAQRASSAPFVQKRAFCVFSSKRPETTSNLRFL
ncbi:hypothetical protein OROMI_001261 [Orobanche minor]